MRRFVAGFIFLIGMASLFFFLSSLSTGDPEGGAPAAFRKSFVWNETVWKILSSPKRQSVAKKPRLGTPPRINGNLGLKASLKFKAYRLRVQSGEAQKELSLSDFKLLPISDYTTDFRCIEGWSEVTQYKGVRFRDFLEAYDLGRKADGKYFAYVALETPDKEYYVSIDMESMLHDQTVLAYEMNGLPLTLANGFPLRLVIPIKYGIKSLKRIGRIYFSDTRPPDYWAERGYDWDSGL
jgi:DMSO/TMAO reductase YedYZ molybdopterin-dependent catalytic subunit